MIHNSTETAGLKTRTSWQEWGGNQRNSGGQSCAAKGHQFFFDGYTVFENQGGTCPRGTKMGRYNLLASRRMAESA